MNLEKAVQQLQSNHLMYDDDDNWCYEIKKIEYR